MGAGTSSPAAAGIETWPWDAGHHDIVSLDILVLIMSMLSTYHAFVHKKLTLLLSCLTLGLFTEAASIRCGGTHCHNAGLVNLAYCSSLNSVVYYMPWIYCCVISATRLAGDTRWALPWLCGALTFGMCGIYEMQGPNMRWWKWPVVPGHRAENWLVRIDEAQLTGLDHLFGSFWQLEPREGHIISDHASDALKERIFDLNLPIERPGLPVMAPYFDMAFGWGVGLMLYLFPGLGEFLCVMLGASAALLWDLPVRLLRYYGDPHVTTVPILMCLAAGLPLLLLPNGLSRPRLPKGQTKDWPLFLVQLANAAFFSFNAVTAGVTADGQQIIPTKLAMLVLAVATAALTLHGFAAGIIGGADAAPTAGKQAPSSPSPSFLDRLQKDAQRSEMDASNTHPAAFLLLTAIQPPIVAALASAIGVPIAIGLLPIGSHAFMFAVSHYLLGSDKLFDITGETTLFPLILYSHHLRQAAEPTPRQALVTALALLWVTRLGLFLGWRIFKRGSDWRFVKLMSGASYNLFGWVCQGTWIFLTGLCVWLCHAAAPASADAHPLGVLDGVGVAITLSGISIAHVADMQKTRWNASVQSGHQKGWIASGLWAWSRHPNYFGEILTWVGLATVCMSGVTLVPSGLLCWVSPAFSAFFLLFTSLMLLEKRIDAKFGGRADYEKYKLETSVLLLWPPKHVKHM